MSHHGVVLRGEVDTISRCLSVCRRDCMALEVSELRKSVYPHPLSNIL